MKAQRTALRRAAIKEGRQRMNDHDISVIALCRRGGQHHAQTSYEAHLAKLREQLKALEAQQEQ
jgi:hypothetical protein